MDTPPSPGSPPSAFGLGEDDGVVGIAWDDAPGWALQLPWFVARLRAF